ncbi:MAG: hypothetical protein K6F67_01985 [Oscillospiraceae bacterium]|jgi:hypothetical protein|nr:hypothetical protein [Oscillospiraceae bacterium]
MVKVMMGLKGSGKTKRLVELVKKAVAEDKGSVYVIEKDRSLTYEIPYEARLIFASDYSIGTFEFLKGFISGLHAGNYDVSTVFIDSLFKLVDTKDIAETEKFLDWLSAFSERENIFFFITISDDISNATQGMKKYFE